MKPELLTETCIKMIVRTYGYPMAGEPDRRGMPAPGDVERIIEVNGTRVYAVKTSMATADDTMPRQFEEWLIELTRSMEIPDGRHNGRTDRRNFLRRLQMIGRKVFRKFIQFKP